MTPIIQWNEGRVGCVGRYRIYISCDISECICRYGAVSSGTAGVLRGPHSVAVHCPPSRKPAAERASKQEWGCHTATPKGCNHVGAVHGGHRTYRIQLYGNGDLLWRGASAIFT